MTTLSDDEVRRHLTNRAYYKDRHALNACVEAPLFDDHYIADKYTGIRLALHQSDGAPVKVRIPRGKCLDVLRAMLLDGDVTLELCHSDACLAGTDEACLCRSPGSAWYLVTWQASGSTLQ